MKPDKVIICGIPYSITYVDNPAEVDLYRRKSLWGEIDYWTRTIRIYDNGRPLVDLWETVIHEVMHGIEGALNLKCFEGDDGHKDMEVLALALVDTLVRNGWFPVAEENVEVEDTLLPHGVSDNV